jgi:creatinine amidohydrolase/Fe(II)-dependent formamide hydrolase-like protein
MLNDLRRSLVTEFRRTFLLNGHSGNHEVAQLAARDVALELPARIAAASHWAIAWDVLVELGAHWGRRLPGHAGVFETSTMLALRPELIASERLHRDNAPDTDPRAFQSTYRRAIHNFLEGDRLTFRQPRSSVGREKAALGSGCRRGSEDAGGVCESGLTAYTVTTGMDAAP